MVPKSHFQEYHLYRSGSEDESKYSYQEQIPGVLPLLLAHGIDGKHPFQIGLLGEM